MSKTKCRRWEEVLPRGTRIQVLCIRVNEYTAWKKLHNAVADAESVAKKFEELGALNSRLRVRRCKNPTTRVSLRREVEEFLRNIDKQSPPEIVISFFAGHAILEGDKFYMLPATADPKETCDTSSFWMSVATRLKARKQSRPPFQKPYTNHCHLPGQNIAFCARPHLDNLMLTMGKTDTSHLLGRF
jgi:hypothetical protein